MIFAVPGSDGSGLSLFFDVWRLLPLRGFFPSPKDAAFIHGNSQYVAIFIVISFYSAKTTYCYELRSMATRTANRMKYKVSIIDDAWPMMRLPRHHRVVRPSTDSPCPKPRTDADRPDHSDGRCKFPAPQWASARCDATGKGAHRRRHWPARLAATTKSRLARKRAANWGSDCTEGLKGSIETNPS